MLIISQSIADSQFFSNNSSTFERALIWLSFRHVANYSPTQKE